MKLPDDLPEVLDIVYKAENHQEEDRADDTESDDDDQFKVIRIIVIMFVFKLDGSLPLLGRLNGIVQVQLWDAGTGGDLVEDEPCGAGPDGL